MSQQEMQFEGSNRGEPNPSYTGYEGVPPHYTNYSTASFGQKLTPQAIDKTPSAVQRLILAIVSLILWMVMCFLMLIIGYAARANDSYGLLFAFVLILFTALIIVINVVFNRKR